MQERKCQSDAQTLLLSGTSLQHVPSCLSSSTLVWSSLGGLLAGVEWISDTQLESAKSFLPASSLQIWLQWASPPHPLSPLSPHTSAKCKELFKSETYATTNPHAQNININNIIGCKRRAAAAMNATNKDRHFLPITIPKRGEKTLACWWA